MLSDTYGTGLSYQGGPIKALLAFYLIKLYEHIAINFSIHDFELPRIKIIGKPL